MPKNKFFREKKKVLMTTGDDSDASNDDYEEDKAHMELMESTEASDSGLQLDSYLNEVFSSLNRSEVESCLTKILEKFQILMNRHNDLKQIHVAKSEAPSELNKENYTMR